MNAYTEFAYVYDEYMDNIPYDEWGDYMLSLMRENNVTEGMTVAELGCGTGTITRRLAREGYECIGIDMSEDMLSIAIDKSIYEDDCERDDELAEDEPIEPIDDEQVTDILEGEEFDDDSLDDECGIIYSCQDMRDFALPYEADAMISIGDSMNYITSVEDLDSVFNCVYDNLKTGGVFIFDMKTIHFFRDILADNTYAQNREDSAFIWDNYYDEEARNNEYELAIFVRNNDDTFERFTEEHYQHGFTIEEVKDSAESQKLMVKAVYDAFTKDAPKEDSERLYYILEKQC